MTRVFHIFVVALLLLIGCLPGGAPAQTATVSSAALSSQEALARSAQRDRDQAEESLRALRASGASTSEVEQASELLRQGDAAFNTARFADASRLYRQLAGSLRTAKIAQDQQKQRADRTRDSAKTVLNRMLQIPRQPSDVASEKMLRIMRSKLSHGSDAYNEGRYSEAEALFHQILQFGERFILAPDREPCQAATEYHARIHDQQRRAELLTSLQTDSVALGLVQRARSLLDDARRQIQARGCEEALRLCRLAEQALKRALERLRETRR